MVERHIYLTEKQRKATVYPAPSPYFSFSDLETRNRTSTKKANERRLSISSSFSFLFCLPLMCPSGAHIPVPPVEDTHSYNRWSHSKTPRPAGSLLLGGPNLRHPKH